MSDARAAAAAAGASDCPAEDTDPTGGTVGGDVAGGTDAAAPPSAPDSRADVLSGLLRLLLLPLPPSHDPAGATGADVAAPGTGAGVGAGAGSEASSGTGSDDVVMEDAGASAGAGKPWASTGDATMAAPRPAPTPGGTVLHAAATLAPGAGGMVPARGLGIGSGVAGVRGLAMPVAPGGPGAGGGVSGSGSGSHRLLGWGSTKGIETGDWLVFSHKSHIAADATMERWSAELGFALPEMVYADNGLHMWHQPSGVWLSFTARGALEAVRRVPDGEQIQVPFAKAWQQQARQDVAKVIKQDADWTFSTDYAGTLARFEDAGSAATATDAAPAAYSLRAVATPVSVATPTSERIDFDKLRRRDPILFFDNVPLFEDELHDCGLCNLSVKVRVMPERWFVLMQFWMRVDGGLIRSIETRVFHEMGAPFVVRQRKVKEVESTVLRKTNPTVELSKPESFLPVLPTISDAHDRIALE